MVKGRRWRCTDPAIPEGLRVELVGELMSARRAVGAAKGDEDATAAARARVQDAKVALGERGEPWWEAPSETGLRDRHEAAVRALLRYRAPDQTLDPDGPAWVAASDDWRAAMVPAGADGPQS